MAKETPQQFKEAIERGRHILITFKNNGEEDGAASALALAKILKKLNKEVEIVSNNFTPSSTFKFLPDIKEIRSALPPLQKFVIKIDLSKNKLASLSYDLKDDNLFIHITPKQGTIHHEDIKTAAGDLKFDLLIVIDTPELEDLGEIYASNTELFSRAPIINIDQDPANGHFGAINLVDISAVSTSEIIFETLQKIWPDFITPEVATLLLTGLIAKTRSFKTPNVSSRTLQNAGKLVDLGGDREEIIKNLYRCRTLPTLKLWGKALSKMKHDNKIGLAWATLTREDFLDSGACPEELPEVIDELIANSPEAKVVVLLYEKNDALEGIVFAHLPYDAKKITAPFNPLGSNQKVKFLLKGKDIVAAEKEVLENVRKLMEIK